MKKVYEPHIIFKESDAKLKRWSKFGLLRYRYLLKLCRWSLFILFWLIWVGMLAASVIIIIYAPKEIPTIVLSHKILVFVQNCTDD